MKATAAALLLTVALPGCVGGGYRVRGSGPIESSARTVGAFHAIVSEGHCDLQIAIGSPQTVAVEAQSNVADLVETTVSDGILRISEREKYSSDSPAIVKATVPSLDALTIRGSSEAAITGARGPSLSIALAGAGAVTATGEVERLSLDSEGAGDARLAGLRARDAVVRVSGVGNAHVNVTGTLDIHVFGVGSVKYAGGARIVHQQISGIGSIKPE